MERGGRRQVFGERQKIKKKKRINQERERRKRKREMEGGREGMRCVWGRRDGRLWKIFSLIGGKAECTVHSAVSVSEHWDSPCPLSSALSNGSPHSSSIIWGFSFHYLCLIFFLFLFLNSLLFYAFPNHPFPLPPFTIRCLSFLVLHSNPQMPTIHSLPPMLCFIPLNFNEFPDPTSYLIP